jgi:hypothetical protein
VPGDVPAEAAMVVRLRESNEARLTADLKLDNAVDGLRCMAAVVMDER